MRASELRKFSHFHMLRLLFPSIFCWYFRYFVSETVSLYHLYDTIYKRQYTDKALPLRKCICAIERSERAQKMFAFSHSKTVISFNILLVLQILCSRNIFILFYSERQSGITLEQNRVRCGAFRAIFHTISLNIWLLKS